jgi:hypothetical protein
VLVATSGILASSGLTCDEPGARSLGGESFFLFEEFGTVNIVLLSRRRSVVCFEASSEDK